MTILLDLPTELLAHIASDVPQPTASSSDTFDADAAQARTDDLRHLALVSRLLRTLAQRELFKAVRLSTGSVGDFLAISVGGMPAKRLVRSLSLVSTGEGLKEKRMERGEVWEAVVSCLGLEKLSLVGCEGFELWWLTGHRHLRHLRLQQITLPLRVDICPVLLRLSHLDLAYI
ncbi:hypothetical protein JCM6882_001742 [Rhodosporidiobolus microsporus]